MFENSSNRLRSGLSVLAVGVFALSLLVASSVASPSGLRRSGTLPALQPSLDGGVKPPALAAGPGGVIKPPTKPPLTQYRVLVRGSGPAGGRILIH